MLIKAPKSHSTDRSQSVADSGPVSHSPSGTNATTDHCASRRRASKIKGAAHIVCCKNSEPTAPPQKSRRRGHKVCTEPASGPAPATSAEGQPPHVTQRASTTTDSADGGALALLRTFARQRRLLVDMRTGANNSVGGYLRSFLGFRWDMPAKERARISKLAAEIRDGKKPAPDGAGELVDTLKSSVAPIEARIKSLEKQIKSIVRTLPVWPWVQDVGGIAEISMGSLIGSCGDLSRFRSPEGLFRVMGLSAPTDKPADWYRPQARAVAWCLGDGMVKAGSRYKKLYDEKKTSVVGRIESKGKFEGKPWSKNHCHRYAHRAMTKAMLADMWAEWNGKQRTK